MGKIRCRQCDICGILMSEYDYQIHIRPKIPISIRHGKPYLYMKKMELCEKCGLQLQLEVESAVRQARSLKSKENV